jgi:hypothetical protein
MPRQASGPAGFAVSADAQGFGSSRSRPRRKASTRLLRSSSFSGRSMPSTVSDGIGLSGSGRGFFCAAEPMPWLMGRSALGPLPRLALTRDAAPGP